MPRPSGRPSGAVWRLLEAWSERHELRPNQTQMARLFDVSPSLLSNWKYMDSLLQTDDMQFIADKTGIPFAEVAAAAAEDAPTALQHVAARRSASTGQSQRRTQDADATAPDPEGPEGGA